MANESYDPDFIEVLLTAMIYVLSRWYRRAILGFIAALIAANQLVFLLQSAGVMEKR